MGQRQMTPPPKDEFLAATRRAFAFLMSYGFEAEPAPDDDRQVWLAFHSESVRVVVEGTHRGLDARVAIGRTAPAAFENYDLEDLMALRGAGTLARPRRGSLKIGTTQLQQVEFYAGVLREIGGDILRGDLRSFPDLEARVEERRRSFTRDRSQ